MRAQNINFISFLHIQLYSNLEIACCGDENACFSLSAVTSTSGVEGSLSILTLLVSMMGALPLGNSATGILWDSSGLVWTSQMASSIGHKQKDPSLMHHGQFRSKDRNNYVS